MVQYHTVTFWTYTHIAKGSKGGGKGEEEGKEKKERERVGEEERGLSRTLFHYHIRIVTAPLFRNEIGVLSLFSFFFKVKSAPPPYLSSSFGLSLSPFPLPHSLLPSPSLSLFSSHHFHSNVSPDFLN